MAKKVINEMHAQTLQQSHQPCVGGREPNSRTSSTDRCSQRTRSVWTKWVEYEPELDVCEPVLANLLISVLDWEKSDREACRIVQRITAINTSAAAAKTFIDMERPCRDIQRQNVAVFHDRGHTRKAVRSMNV